jgi:hypothetical protein
MGIIASEYKDNVDKVWYDSSNIYYSECDDKNDSLKDLKVVFSDGRTYLYENVDVNDYLMFKTAFTTGGSQGKALNKYISTKGKYNVIKQDTSNIEKLTEEKNNLLEKKIL